MPYVVESRTVDSDLDDGSNENVSICDMNQSDGEDGNFDDN